MLRGGDSGKAQRRLAEARDHAHDLRQDGMTIRDEIAGHIAPLGWVHVGLAGDYQWNMNPPFGTDRLRPLRKDEVHDAS